MSDDRARVEQRLREAQLRSAKAEQRFAYSQLFSCSTWAAVLAVLAVIVIVIVVVS